MPTICSNRPVSNVVLMPHLAPAQTRCSTGHYHIEHNAHKCL